jgi:hypothetical protein
LIILIFQIQSDLFDCRCRRRWIVLENPSPDEDIVAAARFLLDTEKKSAVVDLICSIGDDIDTRNWRYCALLKKLESIVRSHSCLSVLIEITNWRTDSQDLVTSVGYVDSGGRLDESQRSLSFLKQTMVLEFKKEFLPMEKQSEKAIVEHECSEEESVLDSESLQQFGAVDSVCAIDVEREHEREVGGGAGKGDGKEKITELNTGSSTQSNTETETSSPNLEIAENLNFNKNVNSANSLGDDLVIDTVIDNSGILDSVILSGTQETIVGNKKPVPAPAPQGGGMEGLMSQLFRALRSENVKPQV